MIETTENKITFELLDAIHLTDAFDCGYEQLNEFLKKFAKQHQKKELSRTFVALHPNSEQVVGYYCVSTAELNCSLLSEEMKKGLPRYPIPTIRIGKLAVDRPFQGQGIGAELLLHALKLTSDLSERIGIYGVTVDAKDVKAANFYLKFGFIPLIDKPPSLLLPLKTIKTLFNASS